jgi:uncharacterized protein YhbP (UPF0306 family)
MDNSTRTLITAFLAEYDTLAIATEHEGQPYVTRVFYAERPLQDTGDSLILYGTFITTSRKLANLQHNARVGLFIGPPQPTVWLEATAIAHILSSEEETKQVHALLSQKSEVAAAFIARVPIVAVELHITWLRITNVTANPMRTEVTFHTLHGGK